MISLLDVNLRSLGGVLGGSWGILELSWDVLWRLRGVLERLRTVNIDFLKVQGLKILIFKRSNEVPARRSARGCGVACRGLQVP